MSSSMTGPKPTEAEVSVIMRDFEHRTGIFTERVRGTSVWQLIRFEVSVRVQGLELERVPVGRNRLVKSLLRGFVQWFRLPRSSRLCKTFDSAYRRETSRGFEDIYFDDLSPIMPDMLKMSSCDAGGYEQRVARAVVPPVFDDTSVIALSAIVGRILPVVIRHPAFDRMSRALIDEFGFEDYTVARIRRIYNAFWWRVLLYRLVLRRVRPRVILCPDSGQFGLMKAAQKGGIAFIEMQHGVFTHAHPNALPPDLSDDEARDLLMPSLLAVYGIFSAEVLRESWIYANNRVSPLGAPFLERARIVRKNEYRAGKVPRITLSTQGIARKELGEFISEFLQVCEADFELIIKLHPAYDRDQSFYEKMVGADPRVIIDSGASANSTHTFIACSDFHLSISSTCHYDSLGIGTPTGILALETHESVIQLLDVAGACLISTPQELARIVSDRAFGVVPEETSRYFFEADFSERVEFVLSRVEAK